jgi:hypothetical protein
VIWAQQTHYATPESHTAHGPQTGHVEYLFRPILGLKVTPKGGAGLQVTLDMKFLRNGTDFRADDMTCGWHARFT